MLTGGHPLRWGPGQGPEAYLLAHGPAEEAETEEPRQPRA